MSQKRNNPRFRKSIDLSSVNRPKTSNMVSNHQKSVIDKRLRVKIALMKKYNMSEEEAEKTLLKLEKKAREDRIKDKIKENGISKVKHFDEENNDDVIVPIHVQNRKEVLEKPRVKQVFEIKQESCDDGFEKQFANPSQIQISKESQIQKSEFVEKQSKENYQSSVKRPKRDVDLLISDLVPDSEKSLSVEVNNISLSFEVGNDKIDNLKEYIIRSIKRNKEKKTHFQALKEISFKIYKGEKVGIIGYNGAGKSTLLNVITGIYPPENGEVKTYGRISPLLSLGAGFYQNYSGRENIYLNGAILGYDKKFLESKYDEIVEFSELGEFIDFPVKNYSSGMMAKLGFSIATIVEPDILIIDEVLGVGDVNFRKKSSDKIRSLMDKGTTVLLVSHSIPQIRELCDKAIWIDQGRIVEIGDVNEVCNHYLKDAEKATKAQLKDIRFN